MKKTRPDPDEAKTKEKARESLGAAERIIGSLEFPLAFPRIDDSRRATSFIRRRRAREFPGARTISRIKYAPPPCVSSRA